MITTLAPPAPPCTTLEWAGGRAELTRVVLPSTLTTLGQPGPQGPPGVNLIGDAPVQPDHPTARDILEFTGEAWVNVPRVRILAHPSAPIIYPDADLADQVNALSLASDTLIATPTGAPRDGQRLLFRITDDGAPRAIDWALNYREVGVTLPTHTVPSGVLYVGALFNAQASCWDVIAISRQP